jgi:hypothetical protein
MHRSRRNGNYRVNRRTAVIMILCVMAIAAAAAYLVIHHAYKNGYYRCCTLDLPQRRQIALWYRVWWEGSQGMAYEVSDNGIIVLPLTGCGTVQPMATGLKYAYVASDDGEVVGVYEVSAPQVLLLIYDFKGRESWPVQGFSELPEQREARGMRLLCLINEGVKPRQYVLSSQVVGAKVGM